MPFKFQFTNPWPGGGNPFAQPHQGWPPTMRPFIRPYSIDPHIFTSPPATQPTIPPGSRSFQFNGQPVYIIPLHDEAAVDRQTVTTVMTVTATAILDGPGCLSTHFRQAKMRTRPVLGM